MDEVEALSFLFEKKVANGLFRLFLRVKSEMARSVDWFGDWFADEPNCDRPHL